MSLSTPFIRRPVATTLLTLALLLAGTLSFGLLPVAPLPNVDFPAIVVSASLPGASPETMASSVATPLERSLGRIAGISEMTSSSSLGSTTVVLVFDLEKDIDWRRPRGAGGDQRRDEPAAQRYAEQSQLPQGQPLGHADHGPHPDLGDPESRLRCTTSPRPCWRPSCRRCRG